MNSLVAGLLFCILSCSAFAGQTRSLEFIGEARFPTGYMFDDTEVGGLSGIDYDDKTDTYIAISDDRAIVGFARFYELKVDLSGDERLDDGDIRFKKVTEILDADGKRFPAFSLDPESIRFSRVPDRLYWTSEGNANASIPSFVRVMTRSGQPVDVFRIPDKFHPATTSGIRNNQALESLTVTDSGRWLVTATENALLQDGPAASLTEGSPVRVLMLNSVTGEPASEYIYLTDPIPVAPIPSGGLATNGLVELLSLGGNDMLAIERAFAAGIGNDVKLYVTTTEGATNVKNLHSVAGRSVRVMRKELLLDLADLDIELDNIEGVTFGPGFADGTQLLLLVSDNNFNPIGQFTQFLAFKLHGRHGRHSESRH